MCEIDIVYRNSRILYIHSVKFQLHHGHACICFWTITGHSKQNAVSYRRSTPFFILYTLIIEDIVLSYKKTGRIFKDDFNSYIRIISLIYPNTAILVFGFYCSVVATHPYIRPIAIFMLHRQLLHWLWISNERKKQDR